MLLLRGRAAARMSSVLIGQMLRSGRTMAVGTAAGMVTSAIFAGHSAAAQADAAPVPPGAVTTTRSSLHEALRSAGLSDSDARKAIAQVKFAIKGDRVCASFTLSHDVLPSLMPLLRAYPRVTWTSDASSTPGSESLVLRDDTSNDTPLVSVFASRVGSAAELEVLGPRAANSSSGVTGLDDKVTRALAQSLVAALRSAREDTTMANGRGDPRGGGLFGELFGAMPFQREQQRGAGGGASSGGGPVERLAAMGVHVIMPTTEGEAPTANNDGGGWDSLAGSAEVRAALDESLLLPLLNPEVYQEVMKGTRRAEVAPHAKAILFTGPPGCGKTSTARILASKVRR